MNSTSDQLPYFDEIKWNDDGLVPAIAQDSTTGRILMMAWMNKEALALTAQEGHAVYYSRSRAKLWHKGESSGNQQIVSEIRLDCDADVIVLQVAQKGGVACHTGRESCFYRVLKNQEWHTSDPVLCDPDIMYSKATQATEPKKP